MAKKKGKAAYLSLYVSATLKQRLERLAAAKDDSISVVVEQLLGDAIEQEELTVKAVHDPVLGPAMMHAFTRPEVLRALLGVIREDVSDDQLKLFSATMSGVRAAASVGAKTGQPAAFPTPPPARKKKGKR
jgi:predicted transcriptional regulator